MSTGLDPVEERIIKYVNDNPGCSKSDIVRYLKDRQILSRILALAHIDKLEREKAIVYELEGSDRYQFYKIYINKDNKLVSVVIELEEFKEAYIILLERSKEIINNKEFVSTLADESWSYLFVIPIQLFYIVTDLIFYRSVVKWSHEIKDMELLSQTYSVVYGKIAEIQLELSKFFKLIKTVELDPVTMIISGGGHVRMDLHSLILPDTYDTLEMSLEIRRVVDSIIKINEEIKEFKLFGLDTVYDRIKKTNVFTEKEKEKIPMEHEHDYIVTREVTERIQNAYSKEVEAELEEEGKKKRKD